MSSNQKIAGDHTRTVEVTIANGASLSDTAEVGGHSLVGILLPSGWDTANITFQAAAAPGASATFASAVDSTGTEINLGSNVFSTYVVVPPATLSGATQIKVRSGTAGSPTNQTGAVTLVLVLQDVVGV